MSPGFPCHPRVRLIRKGLALAWRALSWEGQGGGLMAEVLGFACLLATRAAFSSGGQGEIRVDWSAVPEFFGKSRHHP